MTAYRLSCKWGVTEVAVRSYAAEASRLVREAVMSGDELRDRIKMQLDKAAADLEQDRRACAPGNRTRIEATRAKVEAMRVLAGIEGLDRERKREEREAPRFSKRSVEDLAREVLDGKRKP